MKANGVNSRLISISKTGKTHGLQPKQINMYCAYGQHASMRRSCKRICCQLILINGKKEETRCGPLPHSTRLWKIICAKYAVRMFGLFLRTKSEGLLMRKMSPSLFQTQMRGQRYSLSSFFLINKNEMQLIFCSYTSVDSIK